MKKIFTIFSIFFTLIPFQPVQAFKPVWGYVDSARLIRLHPLMSQFDSKTRRFRDTISEPRPSEDPVEYITRLQSKLQAMENTMRQLDSNYAGKISGSGMAAKKSYFLYWKKRESLRFYAELLRNAVEMAGKQGNFYLNMPTDWTLMPVVRGISSTVYEVCAQLQKINELEGILDVSVFAQPVFSGSSLTEVNLHWGFWRGDERALMKMQSACGQLVYSVRNSFPERARRPLVAGALNLQAAAEEMLQHITIPDGEVPDHD